MKDSELVENDYYLEERIIITDPGQTPIRIDKFLLDKLDNISRTKIQTAIKSGCVTVNEKVIKSNYKVRPSEKIKTLIPRSPEVGKHIEAEEVPLDIIYEDTDILVINKQAGLVVHPGLGNTNGTLVHGIKYHLKKDLPVMEGNTDDRPGIVHRIDKDTTGLMVIAKNEESISHLAKQFYDHSIDREYMALVWGDVKEDQGTITGNLGRNPFNRMQMMVHEDETIGKHAITHYEVVQNYYYVTLVKCRLETGRTHQIRAHMKYIGHTLFNDVRYGGDKILKGTVFSKYKQFVHNCFKLCPRQALHAASLGFVHPKTGERMDFTQPLPEDMKSVISRWNNYLLSRKETLEKE